MIFTDESKFDGEVFRELTFALVKLATTYKKDYSPIEIFNFMHLALTSMLRVTVNDDEAFNRFVKSNIKFSKECAEYLKTLLDESQK